MAFRAFWRVQGMISPPGEVYTDPCVVAATRAVCVVAATRAVLADPPPAPTGPSRAQLETALAT
ncbi:MAG TPA: hypothetical protein VKU77_32725 [Streptosporangiaceae bacterium]|nr:hypothetical protein [Streptosporangiaceae bacterium]